jgi:hypothetical protein
VRYVIVYARSRAFRNYIDAAITKRLLDKLNVKLVSAREDFGDGVYADMMEAVTDIFNTSKQAQRRGHPNQVAAQGDQRAARSAVPASGT